MPLSSHLVGMRICDALCRFGLVPLGDENTLLSTILERGLAGARPIASPVKAQMCDMLFKFSLRGPLGVIRSSISSFGGDFGVGFHCFSTCQCSFN